MIASPHPLLLTAILIAAGLVLLVWETLAPRRHREWSRERRWPTHLGFVAINMPLERGVQALVLILVYGSIQGYGGYRFGLFQWLDWPSWIEWTLSVLLLDLAVWAQHLATHRVPLLWRLHRVHHCDPDLDISTALRFHPAEIGLSMVFKMAVAILLGVPLGALTLFELLLAIFPLFNHANLAMPRSLDALLRLAVVTPDMHRVHHSTEHRETDSNFGFCFSLWDRLLGTYRAQPAKGHDGMEIGLADYPGDPPTRFGWAMRLPFR